MRPRVALIAVVMLVASASGCSASPATPTATPEAPHTLAPPTPTLSALATVAPTGHGRPYSAGEIAALLQEAITARPWAFAPELRAPAVMDAVARAVADGVFTFDGRPYQRVSFGASCSQPPDHCDLTMTGVPVFTGDPEATDRYWWTVAPAGPLVTAADHGLRGFPAGLAAGLDALARSLDTGGRFRDLPLEVVEWELPPPDDAWVLRYSLGTGEGDPLFFVTLDRRAQRIVSIRELSYMEP